MRKDSKVAEAFSMPLRPAPGSIGMSSAQDHRLTAIDIALEPDATMVRHARADNARLLKVYPKGFTLDATHHPHLTLVQQFVRAAELSKAYAASDKVLIKERVAEWKLRAFKYYYIPVPPDGIAGIVVERTEDLLRLQRELLEAVAPFVDRNGTAAAFVSATGAATFSRG